MDRKEVVRALLWAAMVFFAWHLVASLIWPPQPPSPAGTPAFSDGDDVGDATGDSAVAETPSAGPSAGRAAGLHVVSGAEQVIVLGDAAIPDGDPYGLTVTVSNVGAAVMRAELTQFTISVDEGSPVYPVLGEHSEQDGRRLYSYATEKLYVHESSADVGLADVAWVVESQSPDRVVMAAEILNDDEPRIRVRKTIALPDKSRESQRFDVRISTSVENLTDQKLTTIITQRGAVDVRREDPRMDDRSIYLATSLAGVVDPGDGLFTHSVKDEQSFPPYKQVSGAPPIVWTAVANKYFVAFETYLPSHPEATGGDWVAGVKAVPLIIDPERGHVVTFVSSSVSTSLPPGGDRLFEMECYWGPKSREAFQQVTDYVERGYDSQVLASYAAGSCCSLLAFKSITVFMIQLLGWLEQVVQNYGVAIIILVLMVRAILHPVTKKGQVNMMRMQQEMGKLQPKMEEVKKKYGNDKAKQNQEMMKVYQEAGINPMTQMMSSCLPMMLQMPIWIALYTSLNYNIDMRHQPFFLWVHDLTAPDAMIRFSKTIVTLPMLGPIDSFNLLPLLVSAFMFTQQKLMTKARPNKAPTTPQEEQQLQMQKMMPYMTIIFGLMFYNMPSGLNLYIGASSLFGTLEQWRIRKHIEEMKDQPPKEPGAGWFTRKKTDGPRKPSFFEKLQKAAEEAQKVKSDKVKKKRK